jgi:hypothetical protein
MSSKEKIFRLLSLTLVGIGFIAGVAGADKDGADQTVTAIENIIHDIKKVEEVDKINKGQDTAAIAQGHMKPKELNKRN